MAHTCLHSIFLVTPQVGRNYLYLEYTYTVDKVRYHYQCIISIINTFIVITMMFPLIESYAWHIPLYLEEKKKKKKMATPPKLGPKVA